MKKDKRKKQHVYRLIPCPFYETDAIEDWLSSCAAEGLRLQKDGFFAGIACFEPADAQSVKYRLQAAPKSTSMWADNGGEPDAEQLELSERFSWEYVAKLKDFYVFRSLDPSEREMNTDPQVQALALNAVKKRQRSAFFLSAFYLFLYPPLITRLCPLLAALALGSGWTVSALLLGFLTVREEFRAFCHLKKLQNSLNGGTEAPSPYDWKHKKRTYFLGKSLRFFSDLVLLCLIFRTWGLNVSHANATALSQYRAELPFATLRDFAGEGYSQYSLTMSGMSGNLNTVEEHSDFLAPRFIMYNEHARIKCANGKTLDGGLYVDYFALRSPALTRELMRELLRYGKSRGFFQAMDAPPLAADEVLAYGQPFPTLLIRKGAVVVRATFYQSSVFSLPVEEWGTILSESIE